VKYLKIPSEYEGFKYYAVENKKFIVILESKNKVTTEFLLGELAIKYKEIMPVKINNTFILFVILLSLKLFWDKL
jgi:hypothetical protein